MLKNWKKRSQVAKQSHITDAKVNYTTNDLDSEAEIITAMNAGNVSLNAILTALETAGLLETG